MMKAQQQITCPTCGKDMDYLGNIDGDIMLSYPGKYREVYACHTCKNKKTILVTSGGIVDPDSAEGYKEI